MKEVCTVPYPDDETIDIVHESYSMPKPRKVVWNQRGLSRVESAMSGFPVVREECWDGEKEKPAKSES